ncbi:MAG: rRNA maturation RNase YbeY [Dehalococcoidia bacterium]|nr:rRNA maturation RNase YbeY [Dehalococcoidia bacterium]
MEINILFDDGFETVLEEPWIRAVAGAALSAEGQIGSEMGVLITGQEQIRLLHKQYMDDDTPTDVLSFAMRESMEKAPEFIVPCGEVEHLGEVIISYPQAEIQAAEHGHSVRREVAILLIHGVLHLLGYDHAELSCQQDMQLHEQAILKLVEADLP